jgi:hypothetical protein
LALAPSPERAWVLLPSSLSADVEIDRRPPAARLAAATAAAAESAAEPTKGGGVDGLEPEQMPPPYRVVASLPRASLELDARRYIAGGSRRQVPHS